MIVQTDISSVLSSQCASVSQIVERLVCPRAPIDFVPVQTHAGEPYITTTNHLSFNAVPLPIGPLGVEAGLVDCIFLLSSGPAAYEHLHFALLIACREILFLSRLCVGTLVRCHCCCACSYMHVCFHVTVRTLKNVNDVVGVSHATDF